MQTKISVEIDCPIAEVFEYTNNHVAEWSHTVVSDELIERKPGEIGTTFHVVTEENGRTMEFQGVVTGHDPPTASAAHLQGQHFDIDVLYLFEDLGESRTRVTQESTVTGKGLTRMMFFFFGWMLKKSGCKAQDSELQNLKKLLESGAAQSAKT